MPVVVYGCDSGVWYGGALCGEMYGEHHNGGGVSNCQCLEPVLCE